MADRLTLTLALALVGAAGLEAQSLPEFHQLNPLVEARTGLYYQPYVDPAPRWRFGASLDYASLIEFGLRSSLADTAYLDDSEVLRVGLSATRNLDARHFVTANGWVGGSYAGFLDGFLDWYHGLFGIPFPERKARGHDRFGFRYETTTGQVITFDHHPLYLGDLRLGIGRRHNRHSQTVLSVTLPTNTAGDGYSRGTVSVSALNSFQKAVTPRLVLAGSANLGFTPKHGPLTPIQERLFVSGSAGFDWRTVGRLWSFANLYLHSPVYHNTAIRSLDNWEFDIDFGWVIRSKGGREFRFGMTEDLSPASPAIDTIFRLGYVF